MHSPTLPPPTNNLLRALALLLAAALAWLALPAQAAPPKAYSKNGVSFQHPATWKVMTDEIEKDGAGMRSIDLEGPGDAIISLMFIPFLSGQNIETLATRAAEHRAQMDKGAAAKEGPDKITPTGLASSAITRRVGGKEIKGVLQRFGYTSGGETVQLEARFFSMDFGDASSANFMTQSMAEDTRQVDAALGLVMDTLRYRAKR
ncbi:hypothetical protein LJR118_003306 [Acidovorax sp. LjRoot118]|uniref:hypothetical protein n=1 Tax=Acidovorax sp. LjRoot118 TaxID=3342256 RepID=UPI003ECF2DE7